MSLIKAYLLCKQILWPECGWQALSLTDLITGAAVKKQYRKATLCIHPDKVQQKGATLKQKYIAEKVFDILKVCIQLLATSIIMPYKTKIPLYKRNIIIAS